MVPSAHDDCPPDRASRGRPAAAVAAVLAAPAASTGRAHRRSRPPGSRSPSLAWGEPGGRPLLLIHGVTASAADLVAGRAGAGRDRPAGRRAGPARARPDRALDRATTGSATTPRTSRRGSGRPGSTCPTLQVVGHSWGAMTAAAPAGRRHPAGDARPARPAGRPARRSSRRWPSDPTEVPTPDLDDGRSRAVARREPGLVRRRRPRQGRGADRARRRRRPGRSSSTTATGTAGLADLADPAAAGIPTWLVRGDPAAGGLRAGRGAAGVRGADRRRPRPHDRRRAARAAADRTRPSDRAPCSGRSPDGSAGRRSAVRRRIAIARRYAST